MTISRLLILVPICSFLGSCIVVPADIKSDVPSNYEQCGDITYRKELQLVDLNEEDTGYYYSVGGVILSPILVPASLLISGAYTIAHNVTLSDSDKEKIKKCLGDDLARPENNP
ncbi:MAG: hypothetical protein HKP09_10070 [Enterobacterales bacterium]|nr:hypothetical protein [Enterobacterales bacterium]